MKGVLKMKANHIFSFYGGELLAKMGAWWFVSYSYYLYVDRTHRNWETVKTASSRRSVYNRSEEYHVYWLTEVLDMQNLDVHGNTGRLTSGEIKRMAQKILSILSKDNGISEIEANLEKLKSRLQRMK